jgi:MFS family permease
MSAVTSVRVGSDIDVSPAEQRKVVFASSLGTVFEWYDFYLYGSLAVVIGKHFFSGLNDSAQFVFALLAFAAGFFVRPFGAVIFGRLGDVIGRKYTFLITILIMGVSTFVVGVLPGYDTIGMAAPIILIALRLLQGLALGGEYGGAAIYVAEHSQAGKRGFLTSWIQTTATLGLFLSLIVILACRELSPGVDAAAREAAFSAEWGGWRIPFLLSLVLLAVSVWIRLSLSESPLFQKMKDEGRLSTAPLAEAFTEWKNLRLVILALVGLTAGQAVVWYTGQFYALFFLTQTLKVEPYFANLMIAISLLIGTPFFIFFGWLSDKMGRKPIIMIGCLMAAMTFFPIFKMIAEVANPELVAASQRAPVVVVADPAQCRLQFDPVGKSKFTSPCDIAKTALVKAGIPYSNEVGSSGAATIRIGTIEVASYDGTAADAKIKGDAFKKQLADSLKAAGYPAKSPINAISWPLIALLTILVIYVTMVYGPIAAMLVEMFPTRFRYSAMSLPYHVGNGWFGGFLPITAFAIVAATGDIYSGLWYPVIVAGATFVIGMLLVQDTKDKPLDREET